MSKKLKKFLKSELAKIDARINVLEANLSRLVLAAVEAVAPQILEEEKPAKKKRKKDKETATEKETQNNNTQETANTEVASKVETNSTETAEPKTRRRRRTAEEIAAEKTAAEDAKKQAEKSEEKKPRQRRTAEEIAAEKAAAELSADDLRHLEGIGAVYADKLKAQGINNLQDMANISDERVDEIELVIKGFKKRIETNNWRGQANDLLKK